jgi:asparagine synthase (glutamine-hydrolysing)
MCGIAVIVGRSDALELVTRMADGLAHRGEVSDPPVSLRPDTAMATRRLRIVDAVGGRQPQLSGDGRIAVAMNGEIYNHRELRAELEAEGARFRTDSDTEVLATALSVWGGRALRRLNGMYAFVALELDTGEFLAARDPLGVKPLYLIQAEGAYAFCSEMTPLLDAVETGEVMLLPPGYVLSRRYCAPYKSAISDPHALSRPGDPAALDALLERAVARRTPSDLPVALLFSGGIDSTLVAHYARRLQPDAPGYFLGGTTAIDYPFAARYAERSGMELRIVPLEPQAGMAERIAATVRLCESFEPAVVRDSYCTGLLCRQAHDDGYRVILCGEGADELFAGYRPLEVAFAAGEAFGAALRDQCLGGMHRSNLQRLDRASMAWAVEAREPFLDPEVVTHALQLAPDALVGADGRGKAPLRALFDLHLDALPSEIRDRAKTPLNEGSGLDRSQTDSPWAAYAEAAVSARAFEEGRRRFAAYDLRTREELLYLQALAERIDVERVPHLKSRLRLQVPDMPGLEALGAYRV